MGIRLNLRMKQKRLETKSIFREPFFCRGQLDSLCSLQVKQPLRLADGRQAGYQLLILLGVSLLFLTTLIIVADEQETKKQPEIDASLSLANVNKSAETLVIDGKTNLPKDISIKISLKGVNYRQDGISYGTLTLASAITDKKGAFNARIATANLCQTPEEYRAEITVNTAALKSREKELKRAGFDVDGLSKIKLIKPLYLAYPHMVERRLKSALAILKLLNKFIVLYPEISVYLLSLKNPSSPEPDFNRLKEIQTAINTERIFVNTAKEIQKVISQLYTASETIDPVNRNPNVTLILPTSDEVKAMKVQVLTAEIFAKVLQDCYYWFDTFQNVFSPEFWRSPANSGTNAPPAINADKWKVITKKSKVHLDKITDECGQYIKEEIFAGEFSAKADNIIVLLNELNDFSETITLYLDTPEDTKLSVRLKEEKRAIIFRFGKLAPTEKQVSQPKK